MASVTMNSANIHSAPNYGVSAPDWLTSEHTTGVSIYVLYSQSISLMS